MSGFQPKKWHSIVAIAASIVAIGGAVVSFVLKISPFATTEALAASMDRINRHEVQIQVMKALIPEMDKKVDRLGDKIDSLNDVWNRHIQLEHGGR